jgi:hypothetical protein
MREHRERADIRDRELSVRLCEALSRVEWLEKNRGRANQVLSENGCDCECGCDADGHSDDCDRCLACLVDAALRGEEI